MNTVCQIGRLVRDPELRHTASGVAVCNFTIAVDGAGDKNGDTYDAGFFEVTVWDKLAENVAQYMSKGRQVGVTGSLFHHKWVTDSGDKRSKVEIKAFRVDFVGSREDGDGQTQMVPATSVVTSPGNTGSGPGSDDDIPF